MFPEKYLDKRILTKKITVFLKKFENFVTLFIK